MVEKNSLWQLAKDQELNATSQQLTAASLFVRRCNIDSTPTGSLLLDKSLIDQISQISLSSILYHIKQIPVCFVTERPGSDLHSSGLLLSSICFEIAMVGPN